MFWRGNAKPKSVAESALLDDRPTQEGADLQALLANALDLERVGRRGEALRELNAAIERFPAAVDLWLARGSLYYGWSRFRDAYQAFGLGLQHFPESINLLARFAWAAHSVGNVAEAEALMRRVVEQRPDEADAHYGLGVVLRTLKQYKPAIDEFRAVTARDPNALHAHINIGVSLMDLGLFDEAEMPLREALAIAPDDAGSWSNLAVDLYRQGRDKEAEVAYQRALELEEASGNYVDAFVNYASYLRNVGRIDEAIAMYRQYLPRLPSTSGLTQLGMCLLHKGEFTPGWALYEFRWLQEPMVSLRANLDIPIWQGQDIRGRTILVRAEQGVGDVVQFARYMHALQALGAKVLFQGRDGMEELSRRFDGVDSIINTGERLPEFDYYSNLMSLPRFFGNDPAALAFEPYVRLDTVAVKRFRDRLDDSELNVGIVWAGNPTHQQDKQRSTSLALLEPLADIPGVRLVSLQKGDAAGQLGSSFQAAKVLDWSSLLNHFGDTADAIGALDVVISVDTSVAHIAGAIGKPTWVALPNPAEWRWMDERFDSSWYPSAQLFRQAIRGDWTNVGHDLRRAATEMVRAKSRGEPMAANLSSRFQVLQPPIFTPAQVPAELASIGEMREGIFAFLNDGQDDEGIALAWYGEWHHQQLALLARLLRLGQVAVEIGSGFGIHTVAMSRLIGNQGHLIVFENDGRLRRILSDNLRANRVANTTVMQETIGHATNSTTGAGSETIDGLELGQLDWIKVNRWRDANSIIDGSESTIWRTRPKLFVNVGGAMDGIAERLAAFGYACWLHRSSVFREDNFNRAAKAVMLHETQQAILAIPEEVDVDVPLDDCTRLI
jgi:tetratricopeptide (TPR) repeat protein